MNEVDVTKFKEGDEIEHYTMGYGTVNGGALDGFSVKFKSGQTNTFNWDGKFFNSDVRHGFVKHIPKKTKRRLQDQVFINVYRDEPIYSFLPKVHGYRLAISETPCKANLGHVAQSVQAQIVSDEWEE